MAGALRKTMVYLGFAEEDDERYDDLDQADDSYDIEEDRGAAVTPLRRTPVAHVVREPAATLNRITTIHPGPTTRPRPSARPFATVSWSS